MAEKKFQVAIPYIHWRRMVVTAPSEEVALKKALRVSPKTLSLLGMGLEKVSIWAKWDKLGPMYRALLGDIPDNHLDYASIQTRPEDEEPE